MKRVNKLRIANIIYMIGKQFGMKSAGLNRWVLKVRKI